MSVIFTPLVGSFIWNEEELLTSTDPVLTYLTTLRLFMTFQRWVWYTVPASHPELQLYRRFQITYPKRTCWRKMACAVWGHGQSCVESSWLCSRVLLMLKETCQHRSRLDLELMARLPATCVKSIADYKQVEIMKHTCLRINPHLSSLYLLIYWCYPNYFHSWIVGSRSRNRSTG